MTLFRIQDERLIYGLFASPISCETISNTANTSTQNTQPVTLMVSDEQTSNVVAFGGNTMVYESVKRFAVKGLNDLIRVLMENVDDALFELSEKVENDRDRNMYFEAMREIRLKRNTIQDKFNEGLQGSFDRLILNKPSDSRQQKFDELSLVDQADIEDSIAIDNMISKARPHVEDELFAVVERFKVILHRKQIIEDQNPLDPRAICDSFHYASESIDADIQVKLIFYKLFDKFVMSNLDSFYHELNDFFIQKGVLQEFKASQERLKQTSRYMANRIARSSHENKADKMEQSPDSESAAGTDEQPAVDGNVLSLLQQMLSPTGNTPTGGVFATGNANTIQQKAGIAGNQQTAPAQGSVVSPISMNSVAMTALTNLQSTNVLTQPVNTVDPQTLKAELQQQLVTFRQDNRQQTTAADNQVIDIVSMLFDFFFDDETLPDPIKVLIGRLQIPILKVAILDDSFFNHKKHPARKLLDSISKAALGWGTDATQEQALIDKIEKIVNYLLSEFDEDVAVFEQALEDFERFLESDNLTVEENLEQLEQRELEKEQQFNNAQQAVDDLLKKLESKHDFSMDVIDFLEGVWKAVLFNTYLAQGESSNHWYNLKKISSTLIWTLIPKHSEEEKKRLLKTLPPLLRALSKGMELVKITTDQQNLVFQMLVLEHSKIVKQTSKNIVTRVDDKTIWPENKMAEALAGFNEGKPHSGEIDFLLTEDETGQIEIIDNARTNEQDIDLVKEVSHSAASDVIRNLEDFTDCIVKGEIHIDEEIIMDSAETTGFHQNTEIESDDFLEQAQKLDIGTWVEFTETGSKSVHARLSWKSNVTGKYIFVNRQGHKVKNMTSFGFATELRSGRAKLIESVSVFDRAINSFMSTLRH